MPAAVLMPAQQSGSPMTYMLGGKQYIVVAVGGGNYPGELLAFRLPSPVKGPGPRSRLPLTTMIDRKAKFARRWATSFVRSASGSRSGATSEEQ